MVEAGRGEPVGGCPVAVTVATVCGNGCARIGDGCARIGNGCGAADYPNPSPVRTRHPSEPVTRPNLSPRRTGTAHRDGTGRGGESGRARTRPNGGNATAGGCGAFGGTVAGLSAVAPSEPVGGLCSCMRMHGGTAGDCPNLSPSAVLSPRLPRRDGRRRILDRCRTRRPVTVTIGGMVEAGHGERLPRRPVGVTVGTVAPSEPLTVPEPVTVGGMVANRCPFPSEPVTVPNPSARLPRCLDRCRTRRRVTVGRLSERRDGCRTRRRLPRRLDRRRAMLMYAYARHGGTVAEPNHGEPVTVATAHRNATGTARRIGTGANPSAARERHGGRLRCVWRHGGEPLPVSVRTLDRRQTIRTESRRTRRRHGFKAR